MGLSATATFTLKLAAVVPQSLVVSGKAGEAKRRQLPPTVKVSNKAIQAQHVNVSRRDALFCLTTSVATSLLSLEPAEARTVNPEIRRKIMEKLEKIREMAGISKPKADSSSGGVLMKPPVPLNDQPPKEKAEKPQGKADKSKPEASISNGNNEKNPPTQQNGPPTQSPVEAKASQ